MMKKMKLADVPFGKNFEIWGHAYTVLDGDDKGVFVLESDAVCEMPFREENVESESAPRVPDSLGNLPYEQELRRVYARLLQ